MKTLYLIAAFAPLVGAIVAGLFGRAIGRAGAHRVTILSVLIFHDAINPWKLLGIGLIVIGVGVLGKGGRR